jgi:dipeptidyl-peptidase-4
MFRKSVSIAVLALFTSTFAVHAQGAQAQDKKNISVEDIWAKYRFMPGFPSEFNWMADDRYYTVMEEGKIQKYNISGQSLESTILDTKGLEDTDGEVVSPQGYSFSDDETKVLLSQDVEPIYRHSSKEKCYVYDLNTKQIHKLHDGKLISFATFSPSGSKVAYMHMNDIYVYDLPTKKNTRVTMDGEWNKIINGGTDWVYEEEFAFTRAFFWNTDGTRLAFYRFDESHVREFSMDMYGQLYPEPYKFKYPKAGEKNAHIELYFHDLASGQKVKANIGTELDQYIPRITWTQSPTQLAVMRMNRLQNKVEVLLVDASTGSSKVLLTENEETYVEQPADETWRFLKNGTQFLWMSEANGNMHIYLYGMDGKKIHQVTSGNFDVSSLAGVDEKNGVLYYVSSEDSPMERHLYQVELDGSKKKRLTKSAGWHDVSFSSAFSYYLDSYSSSSDPWRVGLVRPQGQGSERARRQQETQRRIGGI